MCLATATVFSGPTGIRHHRAQYYNSMLHRRASITRDLCRCMGKDGGIAFYTTQPKRALLFWAFGAACMESLISINLPAFDRPDTINPELEDSQTTWCATTCHHASVWQHFLDTDWHQCLVCCTSAQHYKLYVLFYRVLWGLQLLLSVPQFTVSVDCK